MMYSSKGGGSHAGWRQANAAASSAKHHAESKSVCRAYGSRRGGSASPPSPSSSTRYAAPAASAPAHLRMRFSGCYRAATEPAAGARRRRWRAPCRVGSLRRPPWLMEPVDPGPVHPPPFTQAFSGWRCMHAAGFAARPECHAGSARPAEHVRFNPSGYASGIVPHRAQSAPPRCRRCAPAAARRRRGPPAPPSARAAPTRGRTRRRRPRRHAASGPWLPQPRPPARAAPRAPRWPGARRGRTWHTCCTPQPALCSHGCSGLRAPHGLSGCFRPLRLAGPPRGWQAAPGLQRASSGAPGARKHLELGRLQHPLQACKPKGGQVRQPRRCQGHARSGRTVAARLGASALHASGRAGAAGAAGLPLCSRGWADLGRAMPHGTASGRQAPQGLARAGATHQDAAAEAAMAWQACTAWLRKCWLVSQQKVSSTARSSVPRARTCNQASNARSG